MFSRPKVINLEMWGNLIVFITLVQDPGTKPAKRVWSSINVGTEIYVSPSGVTAEWTVSDFDVLVPKDAVEDGWGYM